MAFFSTSVEDDRKDNKLSRYSIQRSMFLGIFTLITKIIKFDKKHKLEHVYLQQIDYFIAHNSTNKLTTSGKIIVIAELLALFSFITIFLDNLVLSLAMAYSIAIICSYTLFFFESKWLSSSTYEKIYGMSHDLFLRCFKLLSLALAVIMFVILFVSMAVAKTVCLLYHCEFLLNYNNVSAIGFLTIAKIAIFGVLPIILAPSIFFQIDGRNPLINTIIAIIISLFVGTFIVGYFLAVLVIPLVIIYADDYQKNRYYRA